MEISNYSVEKITKLTLLRLIKSFKPDINCAPSTAIKLVDLRKCLNNGHPNPHLKKYFFSFSSDICLEQLRRMKYWLNVKIFVNYFVTAL